MSKNRNHGSDPNASRDIEIVTEINRNVFPWRPAWSGEAMGGGGARADASDSSVAPSVDRKRVVIVDDDVNVVLALNRALYRDFKIIAAESGRHALDILARVTDVAALMTDLKMPAMDGVQLLAAAKEFYPHVPRILFTGTSNRTKVDLALGVGVLGVLYKPLDAAEVGQFLRLAVSDHWDAV